MGDPVNRNPDQPHKTYGDPCDTCPKETKKACLEGRVKCPWATRVTDKEATSD